MVCREPQNHSTGCYFCHTKGYSVKTRSKIEYSNLYFDLWPVPHVPELPVPNSQLSSTCASESSKDDSFMDPDFQEDFESKVSDLISQDMHDFVRNLQGEN